MARTTRHDGDGVPGAPEVIHLSDAAAAELAEKMTGGSFDQPATFEVETTQPIATPVAAPAGTAAEATRPQGGSFGRPAGGVSVGAPAGVPPTTPRPGATTDPAASGSFGTPAGGSAGHGTPGGSQARGLSNTRHSAPLGERIRSLANGLPELWGLDLALIAISVVGVFFIVTNLGTILATIAGVVYSIVNGAMEIGLVLVVIVVVGYAVFGRRRRYY